VCVCENEINIIFMYRQYIYINCCLNNYCSLEIIESIEDTANSRAAFQALIKDPKYNISDSFDANIFSERYFISLLILRDFEIMLLFMLQKK